MQFVIFRHLTKMQKYWFKLLSLVTILAGILIGASQCRNRTFSPNTYKLGNFVVLDSLATAGDLQTYTSGIPRHGYYPVYYLGKPTDTIRLGLRQIDRRAYLTKDYSRVKYFLLPGPGKMTIFVDTSVPVSHVAYFEHIDERYLEKYDPKYRTSILDSVNYIKAFPILVQNTCDSMLLLGSFNDIQMVRQVKNPNGVWVDIENPIEHGCATGARDLVLEPKEIAIAKVLRYQGDYPATCRLKFMGRGEPVYSNTFTDMISRKQVTDKLSTY